ncbi:hypothetical protein TI04_05535 [Achromatium sp. WMS2]|nr:hypothetical protein TI04_05535 [Achromatium sp. WMS2]
MCTALCIGVIYDQSIKTTQADEKRLLLYSPPDYGSAENRIGGGARHRDQVADGKGLDAAASAFNPFIGGGGGVQYSKTPRFTSIRRPTSQPWRLKSEYLQVLAPEHTGLTSNRQPNLYWYVKPGLENYQSFRLSPMNQVGWAFEITIPPAPAGGIRSLSLREHNIQLQPNTEYRWQVLLEPFSNQTAAATNSTGYIVYIPHILKSGDISNSELIHVAAKKGLWYDAVDAVSKLVQTEQRGNKWHQHRAELLRQGNLQQAAKYDAQYRN